MLISKLRTYLYHNNSFYRRLTSLYFICWYALPYKYQFYKKYNGKKVLFYPELPHPVHGLYKLFHLAGYKIISDYSQDFDVVVYYEDTTFRKRDAIINNLIRKKPVINANSIDISKEKVQSTFKKVFGYSLEVNPQLFKGKYVKKSNVNASHDGIILSHNEKPEKGYVYQRLIDSTTKHGALDLRTPIIFGEIPFVYKKYRPLSNQFKTFTSSVLTNTDKIYSKSEVIKIKRFCTEMGLDYGELDVIRDNDDNKIYIVDVNNTPTSPPKYTSNNDKERALNLMNILFVKGLKKMALSHEK